MDVHAFTTCVVTDHPVLCRDFYVRLFGARVRFDCGWYVDLHFGERGAGLQFMAQGEGRPACPAKGLTFNVLVPDVDAEHARLAALDAPLSGPPEDHPWGDRSFLLTDPAGVRVCVFSEREPAPEFKQFYRF